MKRISLTLSIILFLSVSTFGQEKNGLITLSSEHSVKETTDKFIETATSKDLTVFARIDHAANAAKQGFVLRPTELVIFGNPKAGTPLMQDNQTSGIDLPLKILVWEDEQGKVWLTYNEPKWIASRHGLSDKTESVIKAMEAGLKGMTSAAVLK
jgi:uncharacterized protein (DUF302 family)